MTSPIPSEPRTAPQLYHAALPWALATRLALGAVCALLATQIVLLASGLPALVALAAGDLVAISLVISVTRDVAGWRGAIGLGGPRARFVVAGVLVGLGLWYLNLHLVHLVFGYEPEAPKGLRQITVQSAFVPTLLVVALGPAFTEELVFRGVLARGLATRIGPITAVTVTAIAFGAYHIQPLQMLPAAVLGAATGTLAIRSSSAIPGMVTHLFNNAVVIVVARDEVPSLTSWIEGHPSAMTAACALSVAAGIAVAAPRVVG